MPEVVSVAKTTQAKSMAKPAKEKKAKAATKPASAPSHPPYFEMIKDAILALHERTGSSAYAIARHMEDKHKGHLPANFKKILSNQLKNFAAKGKLVKVKASFKLSDVGKKEAKLVKEKKPVAEKVKKPTKIEADKTKKVAEKKRKAPAAVAKPQKKAAALATSPKMKKVKKNVPKSPAKAKKPKSIKSPAAKKARIARV